MGTKDGRQVAVTLRQGDEMTPRPGQALVRGLRDELPGPG